MHFFLGLDDRLISGDFCTGVLLISILFAAGFFGDGVLRSLSVSEDKEIEVSRSNWTFVRSTFGFF